MAVGGSDDEGHPAHGRRPGGTADLTDVEELEDHLRSQINALRGAGLDEDEAFLVAVKRLGVLDTLAREFAIEYSERLWKQLVVSPGSNATSLAKPRYAALAVGLAVAAAGPVVNLLPFKSGSHTEVLAAIHLPIALWLMVFYAYAGGLWRHHEQRMNYVRFLGRRAPFTRLERWQTAYMPAFAVWAWFVTALFPVIFNYR